MIIPDRFPESGKIVTASEFVSYCDSRFDSILDKTAVAISNKCRIEGTEIITLSGPSCSGKTTAAAKLTAYLTSIGKRTYTVSFDDFYFDKEKLHEMSVNGKIDYDSPKTIDLELLSECVHSIIRGGTVSLPVFDFSEGHRKGYTRINVQNNDMFIFEGIQAVYPQISALFSECGYVPMFICPESSIAYGEHIFKPDYIRLMRRLVRDYYYRGSDVQFTFYLWDSVIENEKANIFPNIADINFRIDSTMAYEIAMLAPHLTRILSGITPDSGFYNHARDIISDLDGITPLDKSLLSDNSIYWEFLKKDKIER